MCVCVTNTWLGEGWYGWFRLGGRQSAFHVVDSFSGRGRIRATPPKAKPVRIKSGWGGGGRRVGGGPGGEEGGGRRACGHARGLVKGKR